MFSFKISEEKNTPRGPLWYPPASFSCYRQGLGWAQSKAESRVPWQPGSFLRQEGEDASKTVYSHLRLLLLSWEYHNTSAKSQEIPEIKGDKNVCSIKWMGQNSEHTEIIFCAQLNVTNY